MKICNLFFIEQLPKVWLFFGCRTEAMDLYRGEKQEMVDKHILDRVFLALSREPNVPKVRTPCCFIIIIIALVVAHDF